MVWRKGICRESLLNCRRTLRKGLNLQNDPVDRLAKRGNPARKGSPLAPTFYRLSFRRAGENSLLAARVLVACCAGARKGEPPLLFCPCRSKVALLRLLARIAPVAPQGIVAVSATGGAPIPCPSKEGNYGTSQANTFKSAKSLPRQITVPHPRAAIYPHPPPPGEGALNRDYQNLQLFHVKHFCRVQKRSSL